MPRTNRIGPSIFAIRMIDVRLGNTTPLAVVGGLIDEVPPRLVRPGQWLPSPDLADAERPSANPRGDGRSMYGESYIFFPP